MLVGPPAGAASTVPNDAGVAPRSSPLALLVTGILLSVGALAIWLVASDLKAGKMSSWKDLGGQVATGMGVLGIATTMVAAYSLCQRRLTPMPLPSLPIRSGPQGVAAPAALPSSATPSSATSSSLGSPPLASPIPASIRPSAVAPSLPVQAPWPSQKADEWLEKMDRDCRKYFAHFSGTPLWERIKVAYDAPEGAQLLPELANLVIDLDQMCADARANRKGYQSADMITFVLQLQLSQKQKKQFGQHLVAHHSERLSTLVLRLNLWQMKEVRDEILKVIHLVAPATITRLFSDFWGATMSDYMHLQFAIDQVKKHSQLLAAAYKGYGLSNTHKESGAIFDPVWEQALGVEGLAVLQKSLSSQT